MIQNSMHYFEKLIPFLSHESDSCCSGYRFGALADCDFILEVLWSKSPLASNPKGLEKFSLKGLWTVKVRNEQV